MTEANAMNKAKALVRYHNAYRKMRYADACADYRLALDHLILFAGRKGWKITYTVSRAGYITLG